MHPQAAQSTAVSLMLSISLILIPSTVQASVQQQGIHTWKKPDIFVLAKK